MVEFKLVSAQFALLWLADSSFWVLFLGVFSFGLAALGECKDDLVGWAGIG